METAGVSHPPAPGRRPTLAFISTVHPSPAFPGTGRFNAAMLRGLQSDWDVSAAVAIPGHRLSRPSQAAFTADYPVDAFRFWYLPGEWGRAGQSNSLLRSLRRILAADGRPAPDLILSYWAYPDGDAAGRLADDLRRPSALIVGGSDLLIQAQHPAHRLRVQRALARHQLIFAVGTDLQRALTEAGVPAEKIRLLQRGVDRRHFFPGDQAAARAITGLATDRQVILWVGRMEPVKDLPTLIQAVATIPSGPLLVLVGEGSQQRRAVDLARQYRVELRLPGAQTPAALGDWYRAADVVALSSRSEGTPNVLLEALASGRPIVTTDAGGAGQLGRDIGAPVVPINDHRSLGDALDQVLGHRITQQPDADARIPTLEAASARFSDQLRELLDHGR